MDSKSHWEAVYSTRSPEDVSWYQPYPVRSLELLSTANLGTGSAIIDVGGGDSTLVSALLDQRVGQITVLDVSACALARARERLGARSNQVTWLEADVTRVSLAPAAYTHWHDRAVFHFLTSPEDREAYVRTAAHAIRPGGTMVIATFADDGPLRCSGLDVARYSPATLTDALGPDFALRQSVADVHLTPSGAEQRFTYAVLERR